MPSRGSRRATRTLARILTSVFFREVLVEGAERVPRDGPVIYAVNHPNSLVDPLIVHGTLPRQPRFLAKHTLWDNPFVRPFLELAGSIPIYRTQDEGARAAMNVETFESCYRALAEGAAVGIFPEGVSHTEPALMPVKTGIARIVLGAEESRGPLGIRVVPVGLNFEERHRFRSRVLVTVGEPLDAVGELPRDRAALRRLRNDLTTKVEEGLRNVTLNYASRKDARLLARAGDLFAKTPSDLPDRPGLSRIVATRRQFAQGYEAMKERFPGQVARVARKVDAYDRMLRATGFTDEQVVSSYPAGEVVSYLARTVARLLTYLPLAALGILLNWMPYRLTAAAARRRDGQMQLPATYKILGGLFIYPAAWALEAALAGFAFGWPMAASVCLLAPPTGYAAVRFLEDGEGLWSQSVNYLRLRSRRRLREELGRRRGELAGEIGALVRSYLGG